MRMKAVARRAIQMHAGKIQNQYSVRPMATAVPEALKSYNIFPHDGTLGSPSPSQLSEASSIMAPGTEVASVT